MEGLTINKFAIALHKNSLHGQAFPVSLGQTGFSNSTISINTLIRAVTTAVQLKFSDRISSAESEGLFGVSYDEQRLENYH